MTSTRIADTLATRQYTVREADLNGYGMLHGGRMLTLADETGFLAAHGFSGLDCLTVAVHRARFLYPAGLGDEIHLRAHIVLTGRSSMWVPVRAANGNGLALMDAVFVYAAVDGRRRPARIGRILPEGEKEMDLQQHMQRLKADIDGERR